MNSPYILPPRSHDMRLEANLHRQGRLLLREVQRLPIEELRAMAVECFGGGERLLLWLGAEQWRDNVNLGIDVEASVCMEGDGGRYRLSVTGFDLRKPNNICLWRHPDVSEHDPRRVKFACDVDDLTSFAYVLTDPTLALRVFESVHSIGTITEEMHSWLYGWIDKQSA